MTITTGEGAGYDPDFLGVRVPMPGRSADPDGLVRLDYVHFTVGLDTARRLAAVTAVNIDGGALVEVDRGDEWHLDPRVAPDEQAGPALYSANDLDRGHLVRRRDPVWGPAGVAEQANFDTFAYPNAAPQAADFNQSMGLWLGLEDYVLSYAQTTDQHLSVFTGPVLATGDPTYRGVQIPRRFYKIAAWTTGHTTGGGPRSLSATGYVLDQSPELDDVDLSIQRARREGQPPPLGPFRTFQVPISDIAALTGLQLGPLPVADRLEAPVRAAAGPSADGLDGWVLLQRLADLTL